MSAQEMLWRTAAVCVFSTLLVAASDSDNLGVDASTAAALHGRKLQKQGPGGRPGPPAKSWKTCPAKGGSPEISGPASSPDAPPGTCGEQQDLSPDFWENDFIPIVKKTLGGITQAECTGPWETGGHEGNQELANKVKEELTNAAGSCTVDFEVLVWDGTHGWNHQDGSILTATGSDLCDGGMNHGVPPGDKCAPIGGTFARLCTGAGKSYTIFMQPANKGFSTDIDIEGYAQACGAATKKLDGEVLLIDFTRCIHFCGQAQGIRGVIAIPTVGIPDPNGVGRPSDNDPTGSGIIVNNWAATFPCSEDYWVSCTNMTTQGDYLTVFTVMPLS